MNMTFQILRYIASVSGKRHAPANNWKAHGGNDAQGEQNCFVPRGKCHRRRA